MSEKTGFERCWEGLDRTLLTLVFGLLAFSVWQSGRGPRAEALERFRAVGERRSASEEALRPVHVVEATAGTPVSLTRNRVRTIARSMADHGWEDLPSSPAADMREHNGFYDIFFALPQRTDPASVKVSASGNVLTVFVKSDGVPAAAFAKQFYIPCGVERAGAIETSVSNDIVRVRIPQSGG